MESECPGREPVEFPDGRTLVLTGSDGFLQTF